MHLFYHSTKSPISTVKYMRNFVVRAPGLAHMIRHVV